MNVREHARKAGGDALVAKIDHFKKVELEIYNAVMDIAQAHLKEYDGKESEDQQRACVALCEAMSSAYAATACVATMRALGGDRAHGIMLAIKSVTGNINSAFDTMDAEAGGVKDLIKQAAGKGGK
jgi:uncharacterized protein (UPF0261 family)